jgi:glycosyltransferase involved in cell wall biosynthesis
MRIAVLTNIVTPYTAPVFEMLAGQPDVELLVVSEAATESNRHWAPMVLEFEHLQLASWTFDLRRFVSDMYVHIPYRGLGSLKVFTPDVVIASGGVWTSPLNNYASLMRKARKWAFIPWWASFQRLGDVGLKRAAEPWIRRFVRSGDAWLAYGTRSARDVIARGADPARTFITPTIARPVDVELRVSARPNRRPFRFLFVGQLIERKGVKELLEAAQTFDEVEIWICGDGELRPQVETAAANSSRIRFLGHLEFRELDQIFASVDALVLPSRYEVWGLVINEAMAFGLPVVVSSAVGAVDDLVKDGCNGRVFAAGDAVALSDAMREIASWDDRRRDLGAKHSSDVLAKWSLSAAVSEIVRAAKAV